MKHSTHPKASVGSCIHKSFEILGRRKLADQNGELQVDLEELGVFPKNKVIPSFAIEAAFAHYKRIERPEWTNKDFKMMAKMFWDMLKYQDGIYNPLKADIINVEETFDITFNDDWAHYDYELPGGQRLTGQLSVKGTIDLIMRESPNCLHCLDYKTGKRGDIRTGKKKEYDDLIDNFQINLYGFALRNKFPEYKSHIFTIWYINDGGAFSMPLDKTIDEYKDMIRAHFNEVRNMRQPELLNSSWFCRLVCDWYKRPLNKNSSENVCKGIQREIHEIGIAQVISNRADFNKIDKYQDGGGRKAKPDNDLGQTSC